VNKLKSIVPLSGTIPQRAITGLPTARENELHEWVETFIGKYGVPPANSKGEYPASWDPERNIFFQEQFHELAKLRMQRGVPPFYAHSFYRGG
jgi:hypothetical protein